MWTSIFYTLRGACWELSVMSQLHHLWGKESSLPLLPTAVFQNSKKGSCLSWLGWNPLPSYLLWLWSWGTMACWACVQHPQHLTGPTHSDHGWSGGQALVTKGERCYLKKDGKVRSAETYVLHAQATSVYPAHQHSTFPKCLPRITAKILRIIDRTKVSTWFLLCCWWSGGGSCQLGELWIGVINSVRYKVRDCTK